MKRLPTLCFFLTLPFFIIAQQIITVDNFNPGADYSDLQLAIDASNAGDTIYVHPSFVTYGNATIPHQLTIFGGGYLADVNTMASEVGTFTLDAAADGTHISGFKINALGQNGQVDSVIVSDCWFINNLNIGGINNTIEGNLFSSTSFNIQFTDVSAYGSFTNNLFYGRINTPRSPLIIFENNVFINNGNTVYNSALNVNSISNIYFGRAANAVNCIGCNSQSDLFYSYGNSIPIGNNPLFISPATLSTNNLTPFDITHDFQLQPGSPAIGAGQGGTDQGAYGGITPFKKGGFPPIPRMLSLSSSSTLVEAGQTIQIQISAKAEE